MIKYTVEELKDMLIARLKPKRYEHSLGVAETAVRIARRFSIHEEKAYIAGLLHDCGREFSGDVMCREADARGIPYGPVERAMPLLLHSYIGAVRVREIYGVIDDEISQAIHRHTVGGTQMTALDKVIWFADMIEPNRAYPQVEMLRQLAEEATLDEMVLEGLNQSILFVMKSGRLLHPATIAARNELLLKKCA